MFCDLYMCRNNLNFLVHWNVGKYSDLILSALVQEKRGKLAGHKPRYFDPNLEQSFSLCQGVVGNVRGQESGRCLATQPLTQVKFD